MPAGTGRLIASATAMCLIAGIVACSDGGAPVRTGPPATLPAPDDALSLELDGGAPITTDGVVDLSITSPPGTTEAQVSLDPSFVGIEWQPLDSVQTMTLHDSGYQMVFARTRTDARSVPIGPVVAGITVDPTYTAATSSEGGAPHQASWAGLVETDVIQVRIEAGRVEWGAADGSYDRLIGRPLDVSALDRSTGYRLDGQPIVGVSRVSRPSGRAVASDGDTSYAVVHDLFLTLSAPLTRMVEHRIEFPGADIAPLLFVVDPDTTPSPAVHVNQVGFAPNDAGKFAFVSTWTGPAGGLRYPDGMPVRVLAADGRVAYTTTTQRRNADPGGDWGLGDVTGSEVHQIDFSGLTSAGRYRVCVADLGCSASFVIDDHSAWLRSTITVARAMYHQRNGEALGEPYTSIRRPRPFHPADGVVYQQVSLTAIDDLDSIGSDDRFDEYGRSTTGEQVAGAWGGHFDAGDWNSRIMHLQYLRSALDLVRLFPETYASLDLDIPESSNDIPDVIDEGLWDLDLYVRLQHHDGGVPGIVDQSRFGEGRETSWNNDVSLYVFEPDVWSTYIFAGVAAEASVVLERYDPSRAATYGDAARRAMRWAEQVWSSAATHDERLTNAVVPQRGAAAAAMLQLTADDEWNDVVAETLHLDAGPIDQLDCHQPGICDATWVYSQTDPKLARAKMLANATESYRRTADAILAAQATAAFAWTIERPGIPIIYNLGPSTPHGVALMRAFVLTGDQRYRAATVRAASFSLGGNPLNTSFVTGLGASNPRYPLIVDAAHGGVPVWPGTFVFGIYDLHFSDDDDWIENDVLRPAGTWPDPLETPLLQSWYDLGNIPMMDEFTVHQTHSPAFWTLGALAASRGDKG